MKIVKKKIHFFKLILQFCFYFGFYRSARSEIQIEKINEMHIITLSLF